jgi:hypothetical protein
LVVNAEKREMRRPGGGKRGEEEDVEGVRGMGLE